MKLQQIEYLNEIFNITFTLQQTLYLIQIAKKKKKSLYQKSILNLWFFLFQNDNNSQEEIRTSMKIYKTAREILLNEIFDQSRNKLEKNRNADSKKKKKSRKSRFSSISPRITEISGQLVTPAGVKPRLAITDRRTNTIPALSTARFICKYTYFRMLAGNGRSKLPDLNKMATKLREHCI